MRNTKKPTVTLALMHNIFLTEAERLELHSGGSIQVVGVQVPVWHERGYTSEPATEVFCRYVLNNDPEGGSEIQMASWGYEFNLPQESDKRALPEVDLDEWRAMSREEQDAWYASFPQVPTSKNLIAEGRKDSGRIAFNQVSSAQANGMPVNVLHYVSIDTVENLKSSLA